MDKNVTIDSIELIIATTSEIVKMVNVVCAMNMGVPVRSSLPPGKVKAAANATVAISVATSMQEFAVSLMDFSPSIFNAMCSFENNCFAVLSSLFLMYWSDDGPDPISP
nr:hypothetical protein CDL15_Pgr028947 [Ipomoea trifida]